MDLLIENLSKDLKQKFCESIKIAVFNSYYTNNAIKSYLTQLKNLNTFILIKPGISDVIVKAKEYDVSLYYESNGKGTIYSNEATLKKIDKLYSFCFSANDCLILEFLSIFLGSFNKTSGDALSTMILFEKSLMLLNLSLEDVYSLYKQIPYDFQYLEVENISRFICDETSVKITSPIDFTNELEDFIKSIDAEAKCYFKININQKLIRIYVESSSRDNVEVIMKKVKKLILDYSYN